MRTMLLAAAMLAVPLSGALANTPSTGSFGSPDSVLSQNPTDFRPGLGNHLGGQVRVRRSYDDHWMNNKLLSIMFNDHGGGH
jgi:hypothetical protein